MKNFVTIFTLLIFSGSVFSQTGTFSDPNHGSRLSQTEKIVRAEYIITDPEKIVMYMNKDSIFGVYKRYTESGRVIFATCTSNQRKLFSSPPQLEFVACNLIGRPQGYSQKVLERIFEDLAKEGLNGGFKTTLKIAAGFLIGTAIGHRIGVVRGAANPWNQAAIGTVIGIGSVLLTHDDSQAQAYALMLSDNAKPSVQLGNQLTLRYSNQSVGPRHIGGITYLESVYDDYAKSLRETP